MDTWVWIVIAAAVVVAVVVLAAIWMAARNRRRQHLQDRFGPEYDRTVETEGERRAQRELEDRERQREQLEIRPLTEAARSRYMQQWDAAQSRFVDDPRGATFDADRIVLAVLSERGYPVEGNDLSDRVRPLSVDHPEVIDRYRHGHGVLRGIEQHESDSDVVGAEDSTEGLREAMIDFRIVFESLVDEPRQPAHA